MRLEVLHVTESREKWCAETKELARRAKTLEAKKAALQEQLAALKKRDGTKALDPSNDEPPGVHGYGVNPICLCPSMGEGATPTRQLLIAA